MAVKTPTKKSKSPSRPPWHIRWPFLIGGLAVLDLVLLLIRLSLPSGPMPPPDTPEWVIWDPLPVNTYSRPGTPLDEVNGIVVHYVGNPGTTAEQNHGFFVNLAETGETYASSHFLIGLDGEIIQNMPLNEIAYCSNERNADPISIECCHPDEEGQFTDATYSSLIRLVVWLMDCYDLDISQVIRHYDVTGKECPRWYVLHPEDWTRFLADVETARAGA